MREEGRERGREREETNHDIMRRKGDGERE